MAFFKLRAGSLVIAALLPILSMAVAGELARPVPSDAQVTRFTRFNIRYSLRDVVADGVQKVEFYITDDMGLTWRLYGEDPDRMSPMTVQVPGEGVYGFVCIATDRFGNREREPVARTHPETVIVVDRTPPAAKWLSPLQDILGRGQPLELKWESSDKYFGQTPVKIQYAAGAQNNHDREATWTNLQENLPANGSINWSPPTESSSKYNFRLIAEDRAGNMAVAYCPATVVVDANPPVVTGVSPLRSNKLENDIIIEAVDGQGGSGVKELSLYVSGNGGGTWALLKETTDNGMSVPVKRKPGSAITYTAPRSGSYALWPVVFDEAGNATPLPSVGVPGPYILEIDTEPPNVSLSSSFLMGRAAILSNESRRVEWTAYDPNVRDYSAVISLSLDNGNTWQELRSGLPASGSETINFPFGAQSEDAKLKVAVSDDFGNIGEDVSQSFKLTGAATTIDSVTPVSSTSSSTPSTSGTGWPDYLTGDGGTPPVIALPPGVTSTPIQQPTVPTPPVYQPNYPTVSAPSTPAPLPPVSTPQTTYGGAPATPWGAPSGPSIQSPSLPPIQGGTGPVSGESSATSIPSAMLGNVQSQPPQQPAAPIVQPPVPPPAPIETPSATTGWTPSPGAGRPPAAGTPPSMPTTSSIPGGAISPPIGTGSSLPPPPLGLPGGQTDTAIAPPPPTGLSSQPSLFEGFDSSPVMPPPLPGAPDSTSSLTPQQPSGGSPFDGPLPPPALPETGIGGGTASTPAPQTSGLRPPGSVTPPAVSFPSEPSRPDSMPQSSGLSMPPVIETSPAERPVNKRDTSNHYVRESKSFQEEGRFDQAVRSATEAINTDDKNPAAFMQLSQIMARKVPPDYVRAATTARAATELDQDWETWWNCAEVYYIWAHARNREVMAMLNSGQTAPSTLIDERNQTLANAKVAINNAALRSQAADAAARKKIANTQGLIAYLDAMKVPQPVNPGDTTGPAADEYRRAMQTYKATVTPMFLEAQPHFQSAMTLDGPPSYSETFHLGMINYRLGNAERDTGNNAQATIYYQEAVKYLEQATTAKDVPTDGPREAYYMLAHCYDILSRQPGVDRTRTMEQALRYWRQTVEFYSPGTPYRTFGEQRIETLSREMGL